MSPGPPGGVIAAILRHDDKQTSYKLALVRAINDVVLAFPDVDAADRAVAIPLRLLAEFWIAYYWPFMDPHAPIVQGQRARRNGALRNDLIFRPALTTFRTRWEQAVGGVSAPSDGFFAINDLRVPRRRAAYPPELLDTYERAVSAVSRAVEQPIRYAGSGGTPLFASPVRRDQLDPSVVATPGTGNRDRCLLLTPDLWRTFRDMSLWVDALCIHEWCLYSERVASVAGAPVDRGVIYRLLTAEPGGRRPLTWERNQIRLLLLEGATFVCPWTATPIVGDTPYALDHLVPVAIRPINELWNLIPSEPYFNAHRKRDRLPSPTRLAAAVPHLITAYTHYDHSPSLSRAVREDVAVRFARLPIDRAQFPEAVARATANFIERIAIARNAERFN